MRVCHACTRINCHARAEGIDRGPRVGVVEGLVFSSEFRVCCVFRALCESQSVTVNCPANNFGRLCAL